MKRLPTVCGIFVGGGSSRMGGAPKGLLVPPDGGTVVGRLIELFRAVEVPCVLVGRRAEYEHLGVTVLDDDPSGIGPLGGLVALLRHAGDARAVSVACDMPLVTRSIVERLLDAPPALAVAPRSDGKWCTMLARYDARPSLAIAERRARGENRSLQGLLDELGAEELALAPGEDAELHDWDSPRDIGKK